MKIAQKIGLLACSITLFSLPGLADENAILSNGAIIRHERRELRDDVTRLYLPGEADNFIDVPTADIVGYEEIKAPLTRAVVPATEKTLVRSYRSPDLVAIVNAAGNRNNINPDLINSMIHVESGFNPRAVSPKGAQGLMQLMPQTAARLGVSDPMDPIANIEGGTRYIRELLDRYHLDLTKALAAYNAGPERVEQYNGIPPYPETIAYVTRVIKEFNSKKPHPVPSKAKPASSSQGQNIKAAALVSSQKSESAKQPEALVAADSESGS